MDTTLFIYPSQKMSQTTDDSHVHHFPLDVPGATPFERYHHAPLTHWDLMVAHTMQDFMNPPTETAQLYGSPVDPYVPWDMALKRLANIDRDRVRAITSLDCLIWCRSPYPPPSLGDFIISLVQRFYLENDCGSFRAFCNAPYLVRIIGRDNIPEGRLLANGMRKISLKTKEQLSSLYNGLPDLNPFTRHHYLPHGFHPLAEPVFDEKAGFLHCEPCPHHWERYSSYVLRFPLLSRDSDGNINPEVDTERWRGRGGHRIPRERGPSRRCFSQPPPRSWTSIAFDVINLAREVPVPTMTLSQLDKRTRRRSLSRGRIQDMFDWDLDIRKPPDGSRIPTPKESQNRLRRSACDNCGSGKHAVSRCSMPCGHCGFWSPGWYTQVLQRLDRGLVDEDLVLDEPPEESHFAPDCPTTKNNRCKCLPFPVYHTAKKCAINCRPGCGHPDPKNHKGNAMTCTYRCCMCGIRHSHAGKDCRLKTCRCGGCHLGQDHSWNPTCRAPGCDKYLCGVHCQSCFTTERPFDEETRKCWKCQGLDERPEVWGQEGEKKRRRWEKKIDRSSKRTEEVHDGSQSPSNGEGEAKEGTQRGYKSIFGDRASQANMCPCYTTTPSKAEA